MTQEKKKVVRSKSFVNSDFALIALLPGSSIFLRSTMEISDELRAQVPELLRKFFNSNFFSLSSFFTSSTTIGFLAKKLFPSNTEHLNKEIKQVQVEFLHMNPKLQKILIEMQPYSKFVKHCFRRLVLYIEVLLCTEYALQQGERGTARDKVSARNIHSRIQVHLMTLYSKFKTIAFRYEIPKITIVNLNLLSKQVLAEARKHLVNISFLVDKSIGDLNPKKIQEELNQCFEQYQRDRQQKKFIRKQKNQSRLHPVNQSSTPFGHSSSPFHNQDRRSSKSFVNSFSSHASLSGSLSGSQTSVPPFGRDNACFSPLSQPSPRQAYFQNVSSPQDSYSDPHYHSYSSLGGEDMSSFSSSSSLIP